MKSATIKRLYTLVALTLLLATVYSRVSPDSDTCLSDNDCNPPYTRCRGNYCEHKGVFPIHWSEFVGAIIVCVTIALGNAVGIGGGAIIVVTGFTLFQFTAKQSVAVANLTIFCAVFTGYLINFHKKHPLKNATLVDYCIVQCQMPLIGLGTFIGTQANEWLPETIMFILLFIVLLYITFETIAKGLEMMKKEDSLLLRQGELYQKRAAEIKEVRSNVLIIYILISFVKYLPNLLY